MKNICTVRTLLQSGFGSWLSSLEKPLPHQACAAVILDPWLSICKHCGDAFYSGKPRHEKAVYDDPPVVVGDKEPQ